MKKSIFYTAFPPPKFLEMQAMGVDISDRSVHFVELRLSKKGLVISKFGEKAISAGVVESGKIKKAEELTNILASLRKEIDFHFVNVSLPEEHAYLFKLRIPNMKKSEITNNLELQIEENVPISAREAVFDYDIIGEENRRTDHMEVGVSVLPRGIADSYVTLFEEAGLMPISFEIEAQAIARCVIPEGDKGTFMIVDFGKTRTGISIVSEEVVRFTSTVNIGGASLTHAIGKALKISFEKAEKIKKEKGMARTANNGDNNDLFQTLASTVATLRDEINKHYIYWNTHDDQYHKKRSRIEKIILCGGDSNLFGLPEYLSSGLRVNVGLANTMVNVNSPERYIPEMTFSDSLRYATAIGLALRHLT
ncbi:MAG: PilM family type IVa pilus assembly protein TapM [Patescibacteria group bacterium]|nr:MAG: PilM family type IVa pilus assembly protein TapM [Patescibacteria group bacterium]